MNKLFMTLWCVLLGCSIIPDDAFEKIPNTSLKKITLRSTLQDQTGTEVPQSEKVLEVSVVTSDNKMSMNFVGSLDPFSFRLPVKKIDYTFSGDLLTNIEVTFVDNALRTEAYTYDAKGRITKTIITKQDTLATYDFVYGNVFVDRITKTETVPGKPNRDGFFQYLGNTLDYEGKDSGNPKYISIFPYDGLSYTVSSNYTSCNTVAGDVNSQNSSYYEFNEYGAISVYSSIKNPLEYSFRTTTNEQSESISSSLLNVILNRNISYYNYYSACNDQVGISYFDLLPTYNEQYRILEVLEIAEKKRDVFNHPFYISKFTDLDIKFEYNYAE